MNFNNFNVSPKCHSMEIKNLKVERLADSGDELYNAANNAAC